MNGFDLAHPRSRGFTLVELVAVLVILGIVVVVGIRFQDELRFRARMTALEHIGDVVAHNMQVARDTYRVRGSGPSVDVNGLTVPVIGAGQTMWGQPAFEGAPTAEGMYAMLNCGGTPPANYVFVACQGLPG